MRSAVRLLVVTLVGLVLALLPVHAAAESHPSDREYGLVVGQQPTPPTGPSTAPTVELDPVETEADRAESRSKIVMGVASVVLIGLVIWGRSIRRKRAKG